MKRAKDTRNHAMGKIENIEKVWKEELSVFGLSFIG